MMSVTLIFIVAAIAIGAVFIFGAIKLAEV